MIQDSYINKLAEKFNITVNKTLRTPLLSTDLVLYKGTATSQQIYRYQQQVGSINFTAIITCPDISKAISKLSEFLQNPSLLYIAAANHILKYFG